MQIPGTERTERPNIERAAEALREVNEEFAAVSRRKAQLRFELLAVMKAENTKLHRYHDENGEEIEVKLDDEPTVKLRKTGEAESDIGEGDDEPRITNGHSETGPHPGLIDQAMKAQAEAGVEETEDGDVVPIEAAKKSKRKGRRKS